MQIWVFFPGIGNRLPILWHGWPCILIVGGPLELLIVLSTLIPAEVKANIMLYAYKLC